jgi:hypothetical protein
MPASIHLRTTPAFRCHLEALAKQRGQTLTEAVRTAVMHQADPGAGACSLDETLDLLSLAARAGSVPAMKELLRWHERRHGSWKPRDPLEHFDQLAARRGR